MSILTTDPMTARPAAVPRAAARAVPARPPAPQPPCERVYVLRTTGPAALTAVVCRLASLGVSVRRLSMAGDAVRVAVVAGPRVAHTVAVRLRQLVEVLEVRECPAGDATTC